MLSPIGVHLISFLVTIPFLAVAIAIYHFCARKVEQRAEVFARGWIVIGVIAASAASLFHSGGQTTLEFYTHDKVHRGWPLPWVGTTFGLETLSAPLGFAVDTLVWVALTCALVYVMSLAARRLENRTVRRLLIALAAIDAAVIAYGIPLLIPAIS